MFIHYLKYFWNQNWNHYLFIFEYKYDIANSNNIYKKVLCIDVDPQGNLTNNFGIDAQKIATVKEIPNLDIIFNTVIPVNIKLSESELENKPINIFDTNSTGYKAYKNLTDELIERM